MAKKQLNAGSITKATLQTRIVPKKAIVQEKKAILRAKKVANSIELKTLLQGIRIAFALVLRPLSTLNFGG